MRWLAEIRERMRGVFLRSRENADRDEELRTHLEMQAEEFERGGMSAEQARRQAAIAFGGVERIREEVREARGVGSLDDLRADVRFALRGLRRNPGFTAVALITLALGIGANAAMFSVVNGVLLRPLAYPDPAQLVRFYQASRLNNETRERFSMPDLDDWRVRARSFASMAGFIGVPTILIGQGEPQEIREFYVTDGFFKVLGVAPVRGRVLVEEDFRLKRHNLVISDALWRSVLGRDPNIIGKTILLRGDPFTVVGIMPAGVRHPTVDAGVWVPITIVDETSFGPWVRDNRFLDGIARLAPGVVAAAAERELAALAAQIALDHPETSKDWSSATVVPLHASVVGEVDKALVVVMSVVGLILLIGCANLANLLLARGSARRREIAIRTTLGAGRKRVMRQLLTESVVLAILGGALGLALSYWGVQSILRLSADTLPRIEDVRLDARVIAFSFALALLTGVLFGLFPALRLTHTGPQDDLRGGRGTVGSEGQRLRGVLVIAQVALAVLLVIGAGLMARSFLALRNVDPGFQPDHLLTAALQINLAGVAPDQTGRHLVQRREDILARVRTLPGVIEVGMINAFPLRSENVFSLEYTTVGDARPARTFADTRYVDPGYFRAMGIPLLRGEGLPKNWKGDVPALLSERAARDLRPNADVIGLRIKVPWGESVVIGIVGDVRQVGLASAAPPAIYFPQLIAPRLLATLVVRTEGDPGTVANAVRQVIREIDPNQPIRSIEPMRSVMAESIAQDRFFTLLFALFGGLALLLAAVGIYGVLAYSVRQRTQEIGVRMALGANAFDVLGMVAGAGMRLVGAGMVIGTGAALVLSRVLSSQLYGIKATDPASFVAAIGFLGAVALLASYIPARRATRVPPIIALRAE